MGCSERRWAAESTVRALPCACSLFSIGCEELALCDRDHITVQRHTDERSDAEHGVGRSRVLDIDLVEYRAHRGSDELTHAVATRKHRVPKAEVAYRPVREGRAR